jgi:pimeloyl-ACP methyl ester carboxylesterase
MAKRVRSSAKQSTVVAAAAKKKPVAKRRPKSRTADRAVLPEPHPEPTRLPAGRTIPLPGRGRIFFREIAGPEGAPVLLLLHGWFASSALNWAAAYESLGVHFRVIAPDQRGHGRGIRSWGSFRLEDCADDAAALLEALQIDSAIAVGYSMGGPVAQLLWRRHPEKVAGLVLCATSGEPVSASAVGRFAFTSLLFGAAGTARISQLATRVPVALAESIARPFERKEPILDLRFAMAELGRHDLRMLLEAGVALGRYRANDWLGKIDVPTAILVTTEDRTVLPEGQMRQALAIRDVKIFCLEQGHIAVSDPEFVAHLREACLHVAERTLGGRSPASRARRRTRLESTVDSLLVGS